VTPKGSGMESYEADLVVSSMAGNNLIFLTFPFFHKKQAD
jgi:hypothetical protein